MTYARKRKSQPLPVFEIGVIRDWQDHQGYLVWLPGRGIDIALEAILVGLWRNRWYDNDSGNNISDSEFSEAHSIVQELIFRLMDGIPMDELLDELKIIRAAIAGHKVQVGLDDAPIEYDFETTATYDTPGIAPAMNKLARAMFGPTGDLGDILNLIATTPDTTGALATFETVTTILNNLDEVYKIIPSLRFTLPLNTVVVPLIYLLNALVSRTGQDEQAVALGAIAAAINGPGFSDATNLITGITPGVNIIELLTSTDETVFDGIDDIITALQGNYVTNYLDQIAAAPPADNTGVEAQLAAIVAAMAAGTTDDTVSQKLQAILEILGGA